MGDDHVVCTQQSVGDRLRAIRIQRGLSLLAVEAASGEQIKAALLSAYERGDRTVSLPRLKQLADFFAVTVNDLLPPAPGHPEGAAANVTIDLESLHADDGAEHATLRRYVQAIQLQRQDYNGRVLTIRGDDLRSIACLLDVPLEDVERHLESVGLLSIAR